MHAGILLALGNLRRGRMPKADLALLDAAIAHRDARVRTAAAIARAWASTKSIRPDVRSILRASAADTSLRETEIPWNWHDLAGLAAVVLAALPRA